MTGMDHVSRARANAISFKRTGTNESVQQGKLGGYTVKVGGNSKLTSKVSEAGKAIGNFFKSVGSDVKTLSNRVVTKYEKFQEKREFNATRSKLEKQLPTGVSVDKEGNLGGTYVASGFPTDKLLGNNSGKTFSQTMEEGSLTELSPKTGGKNTPVPVYDGIPIAHQAKNDFYRMDMTFGSGGGNFDVRRDVTVKGEDERNRQIVGGLRAFTGSDNATSILSSILTQNLSRPILECFANEDGSRKPMSIEQGKVGGPFHVRDQNGAMQEVEPGGIGNLKVSVERGPNGNYKITGHWEMFLRGEGRAGDTKPFEGMDGSLVRADGKITMLVDSQYADQGELRFISDPSVSVDFSGKMST